MTGSGDRLLSPPCPGRPDGHRTGFDQIVQAEAGLMSLVGDPDGEPTRVGLPMADLLAGMFGAYGVSLALVERGRTGEGSGVEGIPMATRQAPPSLGDHDDRIDDVWVTEGDV